MGWRMIYDNERVYTIFELNGNTLTNRSIFDADTEEECFDKIDELGIYHITVTGDSSEVIFSGGSRTISEIDIEN